MFLNCTQEVFYCVRSHDIVHILVHLYPHVLNVLVQYLTCTSPEYWVCLPNSLEHGVTLSWCNMSDGISYMRLAKCKQNKYLCCESQPHTHTHPVTPTHAHTHMHICVYTQEGFLPLHNASVEGYDGIVEMLLQAGATVDLQTKVEDCSSVMCCVHSTLPHNKGKQETCPAHSQWLMQFSTTVDTVKCSYQKNNKSRYCQIRPT